MSEHELLVNSQAPDFSLMDETGKRFRLSDFRGVSPVVLFFYPGDFTPGCTMQLCGVRDDWSKFKMLNIAVYGINHGKSDAHLAFREKYNIPFPLLIDSDKKVSTLFGAVRTILKTKIIRRSVIGIDKDGIIRYLKRGFPKNQEIIKAMSKSQNKL